jgi:hypothetical protein
MKTKMTADVGGMRKVGSLGIEETAVAAEEGGQAGQEGEGGGGARGHAAAPQPTTRSEHTKKY